MCENRPNQIHFDRVCFHTWIWCFLVFLVMKTCLNITPSATEWFIHRCGFNSLWTTMSLCGREGSFHPLTVLLVDIKLQNVTMHVLKVLSNHWHQTTYTNHMTFSLLTFWLLWCIFFSIKWCHLYI